VALLAGAPERSRHRVVRGLIIIKLRGAADSVAVRLQLPKAAVGAAGRPRAGSGSGGLMPARYAADAFDLVPADELDLIGAREAGLALSMGED